MGACASSPSAKTTAASVNKGGGGGGAPASESFRRPSSIMVMDMLGRINEYKQPIPARNVLSENPHFYLCNSETVHIGTCMPRVPDEEELLPGRIYFLVPLSHSDSPLSLPLLCDLAVKAGSALPNPNNNSYNGCIMWFPIFMDVKTARAEVGVEALSWSEKLGNVSSLMVRYQRNKKGCEFANLTASRYGGNQLWAGVTEVAPRVVVEEWVKEKKFYVRENNTCVGKHECGVYTQVVWRNSTEVGCAQAVCVKEQASLTICFYDPPGNVIGEIPY
uniref:SCP domain-containing protein n=1 Tax=Glycine max TaxID=3847 RepID=A0A368UIM9_SOYBN